jgi:spore coat polysaccharide biosynthesis protein SpsF
MDGTGKRSSCVSQLKIRNATGLPDSINAFVQARMSSRRFPGKVLTPFRGQALIMHVLAAVTRVLTTDRIVVVTSDETSDDPLVSHLRESGVHVFRGPLENVFERFRLCALAYPCEWILRVSADSPLLNPQVLQAVIAHSERPTCDLVTTIFPRTFPNGQNAELIRASTFMALDPSRLSSDDREHVTQFYYRNPERFRIANVESGNPRLAESSLAVDTVEDLQRLERLSPEDLRKLTPPIVTAGMAL